MDLDRPFPTADVIALFLFAEEPSVYSLEITFSPISLLYEGEDWRKNSKSTISCLHSMPLAPSLGRLAQSHFFQCVQEQTACFLAILLSKLSTLT